MQTPSSCLKIAALFALAASAVLPAAAQAPSSGPTSTVVYAGGDDLVIKSSEGKLLNYNVSSGTKFTAGGKQVGLSDLKPGTKLSAPVAGTPQVVTGVQVVKGKVYGITPPNGVTLSLAEGVKDLTVPAGTTFMVDGKKLAVSDLKNDMMVEATIVTTAAEGTSASSAPAQSGALLVAKAAGEEELPAAGTHLPLFAALGLGFLMTGFTLIGFRRRASQV
jgi:LPXTG-motif cell wall-anchored protein